jgi:uncharacterized protein YdbL (DUF1318 family)
MTLAHIALAALLLWLGPQPAQAAAAERGLYQAKEQGLIGERADGLVGIVSAPGSTALNTLAKTINQSRLERYRQIASKRGLPLDAVQKLAGENLIDKTPPGQFVLREDGKWTQKEAHGP